MNILISPGATVLRAIRVRKEIRDAKADRGHKGIRGIKEPKAIREIRGRPALRGTKEIRGHRGIREIKASKDSRDFRDRGRHFADYRITGS